MCLKSSVLILSIRPLSILVSSLEGHPSTPLLTLNSSVQKLWRQRAGGKHKPPQRHLSRVRGGSPALRGAILGSNSGAQRGGRKEQSPVQSPVVMASTAEEIETPLSPALLEATPEAITKPILAAIEGSKTMLMVKVEHLASECTLICHDLDKIRGRLSEAEGRISTVEDQQSSHSSEITELQSLVHTLVNKVDDAENRQQRNNIRIVGLPEGEEGSHPAIFAESLFKNVLKLPDMPPTYVVERAHRVPTGRHPEGAPPRPFLVRFLNYRDRDMILAEARKHAELPYENTK